MNNKIRHQSTPSLTENIIASVTQNCLRSCFMLCIVFSYCRQTKKRFYTWDYVPYITCGFYIVVLHNVIHIVVYPQLYLEHIISTLSQQQSYLNHLVNIGVSSKMNKKVLDVYFLHLI